MIGQHERTQTGYRDNLLPWQQEALFQLWTRFFRLCQTPAGSAFDTPTSNSQSQTVDHSASTSASASHQPSRENLAHAISVPDLPSSSSAPAVNDPATASSSSSVRPRPVQHSRASTSAAGGPPLHIPKDDQVKLQMQGQHEAKEMRTFLAKYGGERLRKVFWQMVKGEHPDAVMLRLLRARKWNIDRAVAVLGSTAAWRVENDVESITRGGELLLTSTRGGFNVLNNGVSYMYGATPNGEPVYIIEVGNHFSSSQTQDELKRAVILLQETLGSLMPPPVERKIVIFNMNNFGIRNMDWWCVFFMVKTMECFYVETLARVYVHGAPWIFKPIWTILKPLLDPVVRDKIRLTSDAKELEEYIPWDHLPKGSMKGGMDWEFRYPHPVPGENDQQKDTVTRDRLEEEYFANCFELERATKAVARSLSKAASVRNGRNNGYNRHSHHPSWQDGGDDAASFVGGAEYDEPPELAGLKAHRDVLATRLRVSWLKLRPYVIGKTKMDRWDVVQKDGTLKWQYPKLDGTVEQEILGKNTSLAALQRSLAAIERSMSGQVSDDGDDEEDDDEDEQDGLQFQDARQDARGHHRGLSATQIESDDSAGSNRKHARGAVVVDDEDEFVDAATYGGASQSGQQQPTTVLAGGAGLSQTFSNISMQTADSRLSAQQSLRNMNGNKKSQRRGSAQGSQRTASASGTSPVSPPSTSPISPPSEPSSSTLGAGSKPHITDTTAPPQLTTSSRPRTSASAASESSDFSRPSTSFHSMADTARQNADSSSRPVRGSYGSDLLTPATSVEDGGGSILAPLSRLTDVDVQSKSVPVHPLDVSNGHANGIQE
ncbi:unnamed protein product [Sympodiomycopsis kandeliae]